MKGDVFMALLEPQYAFITGNIDRVRELVSEGTIKPGTLCVTSVGNRFCVVRKDNTVSALSDDEHIFESVEDAESYLADTNSGAKNGQLITVKNNGTYKQYVINSTSEGKFEMSEFSGGTTSSPVWEEI